MSSALMVDQAGISWLRRGWEKPAPKPEPMLGFDFPLRPGVLAYLRLPLRLTPEDAERIKQFVHALAFEETR